MPELPEVEALAQFLRHNAVAHTVAAVHPAAISVLKTYDPPLDAITGQTVTDVARHGKFLDLTIGGLHLVIHLARAGWLRWRDEISPAPPRPGKGPLALRLRLDDRSGFELTEAGTHKRLAVHLVRDPADVPGIAALGVDPLSDEFTLDALTGLTSGRRTQLKGLLRDQNLIAGIGNAYSDEILHVAKLSPFKVADELTAEQVTILHDAIVDTLREAAGRASGMATSDLKDAKRAGMRVHGRGGEPCPVCGDTVRDVHFADSTLQYCPTCQTGGKILADRRMSKLLK